MRLLIDEDTAVQLIEPLRHVLFGHDVMHVSGLSWKGKKDLRVLPDAKNAGFHALITKDRPAQRPARMRRDQEIGTVCCLTPPHHLAECDAWLGAAYWWEDLSLIV